MNQVTLEERVRQQLIDCARTLPMEQAVPLLALMRHLQKNPGDKSWAWALCLDEVNGENGKCSTSG